MNRDEHEASKENMTGVEQIALGSLPAEILGAAPVPYVLDLQSAVNKAVSRATKNSRQWTLETLRTARQAARPLVEKNLRQQGKAFAKSDVRTEVRKCLALYVERFGVTLPGSMVLGKTDLEAMAGEICGALDMPWMAVMSPQLYIATKAANAGQPQAKSWLKKVFGKKSSATETAPAVAEPAPVATPAVAPATPATTAATTTSGDSKVAEACAHFLDKVGSFWKRPYPILLDEDNTTFMKLRAVMGVPFEQVIHQCVQDGKIKLVRNGKRLFFVTFAPGIVVATQEPEPTVKQSRSLDNTTGSSDSLGVAEILGSSDSLGAWLHKLNPLYWLKSSEERKLTDAEKQAWIDNAKLQKQLGKKQEVVESAERALAAKQAVEAAKARSAEMEAQLKAIESQVLGACSGTFVGTEFVGTEFVGAAEGLRENPFSEKIPEADAAVTLKKISTARKLNDATKAELETICAKMQAKVPLTPEETSKVLILLARNEQLHEFRKALVAGDLFAKNPSAPALQKHVTLGAMKAMTPSEQQMMAQMIAMAKQGNPNAQKAIKALQDQGYAVTMGYEAPKATLVQKPLTPTEQAQLTQMIAMAKQGNPNAQKALKALQERGYNVTSSMGFGVSDAFHVATAPIVWSTSLVAKGAQKLFGRGGGGSASPQQLRLQRMQAAQKRRQAAEARARAADAETAAEYRSQQALAAAADAEADAADAEANAKEAAMVTAETQYAPAGTPAYDQAGTFVGYTKPIITPLPPTPAPKAAPTQFQKDVRKRMAKKTPVAAKILSKSEENSPEGMKLRASMEMYRQAKASKKSPAYKAATVMVKKAKKGDPQAKADVRALKAAALAVNAEKNAQKHVTLVYNYRAANAKGKAVQKRAEVAMSEKLIRQSRARKLGKVAKIERKAAVGDPKAVAFVKTQVAKAKAGDKQSQQLVAAMQLAQHVRKAAPTRREKRNLVLAHRQVKKVAKGNHKAIMQTRVIAAAAKAGNPNAKRARARLQTAAAYEQTLKTGTVVLPAVIVTSEIALKREQAKKAQVAKVEAKVNKGTASREEAQAAAKAYADLGNKEKARELAAAAPALPSATEALKQTAAVAAAAEAGSPAHIAALNKAEKQAAAGEPAGVEAMGKVAAVQALNQTAKGKPLSPEMKVAVQDLAAAQAGNVVAQEKVEAMQTKAAEKDPVAIKYMVAATGAAVVARSLASNPVALEEWHKKAGVVAASTETENTPVVDAEIVTSGKTSLPDVPLAPITSLKGFLKASLRALTLATRDPFANYREGVASKARKALEPVSSAGAALPLVASFAAPLAVDAAKSVVKETMISTTKDSARAGMKVAKKGVGKKGKKADDEREEVNEEDYMVHGEGADATGVKPEAVKLAYGPVTPAVTAALQKRQAHKVDQIKKLILYKNAEGHEKDPIYMDSRYYDDLMAAQARGNQAAKADLAIIDYFLKAGQLKKVDSTAEAPSSYAYWLNRRLHDVALSGDGTMGTAKLAKVDTRPPSAGKVIDMSKEPKLKAKATDENDYEMYGDETTEEKIKRYEHVVIQPRRVVLAERAAKGDSAAQRALVELDRQKPLEKRVSLDLLGSDVPSEHQQHVEPTKAKLAGIKAAADKGDKDAQKKWATVTTNLTNAKAKAAKGDEKAKSLVAVLEATGLFKK